MFLTQTIALFVDAYRELNARKLFWISMAISGLIVLIFAAVGIDQNGIVILWKHFANTQINTRFIDRGVAYKTLFETLGINWWLTWAAPGLALVSTASLFPDFLAGGAIDLYLSKPIGRVRLFVTKYVCGLLFVALQVIVFCVASFLVIGIRGGVWERGIFVAVPLALLFFSYLYAVLIFFGVTTRSTIASLLLTILVWVATVAAHVAERETLHFSLVRQLEQQSADRQIAMDRREIDDLIKNGAHVPVTNGPDASTAEASTPEASTAPITFADSRLQVAEGSLTKAVQDRSEITDSFAGWHRVAEAVEWPLPKTTLTYDLTKRVLGERMRLHRGPPDGGPDGGPDDNGGPRGDGPPGGGPGSGMQGAGMQGGGMRGNMNGARNRFNDWGFIRQADAETDRIEQSRSAWFIIGTSLMFEVVVAGWACWLFWRRDF